MFITGDLVRIPQACRLVSANDDSWKLKVLQKPQVAIIIKHGIEKSKILFEDNVWQVETRHLQTYGENNVRQIT
tara:strand:+ start:466 stop:687 length:222 start_codon:yes stop_codon:yes gene_type:complete